MADPWSSEAFLARAAKSCSRLHLLQESLGQLLGLGVAVALLGLGVGADLDQDVAGAGLLVLLELLAVLLIVGFEITVGHGHSRAQGVAVHEEVGGDPLLGEAIGFALGLEAGLRLLVADRRLAPKPGRVHEDVLRLHLLVAAAELALGLGRRHPGLLGHEPFELLAEHATA